jgi:hypothetical protein
MKSTRFQVRVVVAILGLLAGCGSSSGSGDSTGTGGHAGTGGEADGGLAGGGGSAGLGGLAGGGSSGTSGAAGTKAATGGTGSVTAGTGGSAGATGSGGPAGGHGGVAGAGGKIATIVVTQSAEFIPGFASFISAGAVATFQLVVDTTSQCSTTILGACQVEQCPATTTSGGTSPQLYQAGTVTITGLNPPTIPLPLSASTGSYMSAAYTAYLWTASQMASVSVTGSADVPAFAVDVTAPNPVSVTAPMAPSGAYSISRGSDLNVTWIGGVEGSVTVGLSSSATAGPVSVACSAKASAGTVTIPLAALASLGTSGGFSVAVSNTANETISDWFILFEASTTATSGAATFTN